MNQGQSLAIKLLNSGIQINQILTNDDEAYIPRLSSILLAVGIANKHTTYLWKGENLTNLSCLAKK